MRKNFRKAYRHALKRKVAPGDNSVPAPDRMQNGIPVRKEKMPVQVLFRFLAH